MCAKILTIGKMAWEVRERNWDLIVVDAVASGHIVGQLTAAQSINELVSVGLIRQQTDWMVELLGDPATTGSHHHGDARGDAGQRDARAGRRA